MTVQPPTIVVHQVAFHRADEGLCIRDFSILPLIGLCSRVHVVAKEAAAHLLAADGAALGGRKASKQGVKVITQMLTGRGLNLQGKSRWCLQSITSAEWPECRAQEDNTPQTKGASQGFRLWGGRVPCALHCVIDHTGVARTWGEA